MTISDLFEKMLWLLFFVAFAFVLWGHQDWAKVVAIVGIVVAVLWCSRTSSCAAPLRSGAAHPPSAGPSSPA